MFEQGEPVSFRLERGDLEEFDKIWKGLEYPSRSYYLRKIVKRLINVARSSG